MIRPQSWLGSRNRALLALLLLCAVHWVTADNPKDHFCRRYAHQATVIDDKLYIDGGWVNYKDFPKTNQDYSIKRGVNLWPDLNISLSKNDRQVEPQESALVLDTEAGPRRIQLTDWYCSIPSVNGGVLWGDDVNKRFYLYGGDWNGGFAREQYHLLSYDILYDQWDDFGEPGISPPPMIASYGAGVGVSATGMGYYLGGWISNASMTGWAQDRNMSSNFYAYNYDTGEFTQAASPDKHARAEGAMVWIPAGDALGLLVYMGGVLSRNAKGKEEPQPFDEVFVFDAQSNSWYTQKTTGQIPQNRRQFCIDVAWAPDKSTINIYLWGGLSVPPPVVNTTSFADVYILTLPSFTWVKAWPDLPGNATMPPEFGHYSSSCNMVKSMSQLFVIGGTYSDTKACDLGVNEWAQHNFWTGTSQNAGNNETYWDLYDPTVTTNVVPAHVYNITGGDKDGGATLDAPKAGFDSGNSALEDLLGRRPAIAERSPTRKVSSPTKSPTATATPSPRSGLSIGAIVGISIGGTMALAVVLTLGFCIGRRVVRRREERRRQSNMTQAQPLYFNGSPVAPPSMVSPQTSVGYQGSSPTNSQMMTPYQASPLPPTELPAEDHSHMHAISELPQQRVGGKGAVSPVGVSSHGNSPAPASRVTPEIHHY
ncbi:hypothetical protein FOMA001_g20310 [Fusarium oxysporum f. sp. matthiolae]|nr:hypothetical protein FOMA001_g20310 [Fusarium oxysporum f. sp. matthiolae]